MTWPITGIVIVCICVIVTVYALCAVSSEGSDIERIKKQDLEREYFGDYDN